MEGRRPHGSGIRKPSKRSRRELERHFEEGLLKISKGSSGKAVTDMAQELRGDITGTHLDNPENHRRIDEHLEIGIPASAPLLLADLETSRLDEEHIRGIWEALHGKGHTTPALDMAARRGHNNSIRKQIDYVEQMRYGQVPIPDRKITEEGLKALKYPPEDEGTKSLMRHHDRGFLLNYALNLAKDVKEDEKLSEQEKAHHLGRLSDLLRGLE